MGYRRKYTETIYETFTVHFPEVKGGGSKQVSVEIPIDFTVDVDTLPFDRSVESCNEHINFLTGAVVTAEAVQIASIHENSK